MPDTLESIMAELRERINTEDTTTNVSKEEIEEQKAFHDEYTERICI